MSSKDAVIILRMHQLLEESDEYLNGFRASLNSLFRISEIGLPVDDVPEVSRKITEMFQLVEEYLKRGEIVGN